jgi:phosphoenolpyruvate synthase/pyruvate phosphate dikinase
MIVNDPVTSPALRPEGGVSLDVLWLDDPACADVSLVGGKAANLSRFASCHPVPPGFCLTTRAFERAWAAGFGHGESAPLREALPSVHDAIQAAYQSLAERARAEQPTVAVRSSAVDEDGALASFAGQHETYLGIVGADAVAEAVVRCWDSARAERALEYRRQQGLSTDGVRLAVLVQQLIRADVAAVVFSANPVTGARDQVVINASWGLGESIVGGTVTPDTYVVRKRDLAVDSRRIADKRRMTVSVPGGTEEVDVPRFLREQPALDDARAAAMARMALDLESSMGWPVDVECAFQGDQLYLLQCRPITTLTNNGGKQ